MAKEKLLVMEGGLPVQMYKGSIDASLNPMYPSGMKMDIWNIERAGKLGGPEGLDVLFGDILVCSCDHVLSMPHKFARESWYVVRRAKRQYPVQGKSYVEVYQVLNEPLSGLFRLLDESDALVIEVEPETKPSMDLADVPFTRFQGLLACDEPTMYPAGEKGDNFLISSAGRIGGETGPLLEVHDWLSCVKDTLAGDHEEVGGCWKIYRFANPNLMLGYTGDQLVDKEDQAQLPHWPDPRKPFRFDLHERIQHYKGGVYQIVGLPDDNVLEATREPAYAYMSVLYPDKRRILRSQAEMEDGRFVSIRKSPIYGRAGSENARLDNAMGQLKRYGDALERVELVEILEILTDLNDDYAHGRDRRLRVKNVEDIQRLLVKILAEE